MLLADLPAPPPGMRGWPWTEDNGQSAADLADLSALPRISVVTPSFNQAQFLEETIRSVVLQRYPNLEYIIIDGGSNDGTSKIIEKYADHVAYWVSEADRGQSDAINKGFARATGEIYAWLNSDDVYLQGSLSAVARAYSRTPGSLIAGQVLVADERDGQVHTHEVIGNAPLAFERLVKFWEGPAPLGQPGIFFPAAAWRQAGGVDEDLTYAMDYSLLCTILQSTRVTGLPRPVARFRLHRQSKTTTQATAMFLESLGVSRRHWHMIGGLDSPSRRLLVDLVVQHFGQAVLARNPKDGVYLLGMALALDPLYTIDRMAFHAVKASRSK